MVLLSLLLFIVQFRILLERNLDEMRFTMPRNAIRTLVMGPPGSGKGTVSSRLSRDFDMQHLSSGDLLRAGIRNGTKSGLAAQKYIESGKLVPDGVMISLMLAELRNIPPYKSWILDGFPRTLYQAEALYNGEHIDTVINLDVPFHVITDRLSGRWIHPSSGRVYNDGFNPPQKPGYDDVTGEPLVQREDDKPETIRKRLETYQEQTEPVLQFFDRKNLLRSFKGEETDAIYPHVVRLMRILFSGKDEKRQMS